MSQSRSASARPQGRTSIDWPSNRIDRLAWAHFKYRLAHPRANTQFHTRWSLDSNDTTGVGILVRPAHLVHNTLVEEDRLAGKVRELGLSHLNWTSDFQQHI